MTLRTIITARDGSIISITADQKVADAVKLLDTHRIGAVPVIDNGEIVGIFSERDVIHCLAAKGSAALDETVSSAMTSPPIVVEPDLSVLTALSLMTRRRIRHLPVVENGVTVGFVSIGDLVKYRIDHIESEASAMRNYIQGVT